MVQIGAYLLQNHMSDDSFVTQKRLACLEMQAVISSELGKKTDV